MNFLNARTVRLVEHFQDKVESVPMETDYDKTQMLIFSMKGETPPDLIELVVSFDKNQKLPRKLSVSVNQYTMNPFDMEIKLTKKGFNKPYYTTKMGELRTIIDIQPDTRRLVFSVDKDKNIGKYAQIRIGVNYIEF